MQYSDFEKKLTLSKNKNVLLGFSGGADSCALFLILAYWQKKIPFTLTAIHFEHGLRGRESLADAEFCRSVAEKFNIPFRMYHLSVPENMLKNETMEEAARRMRLRKWQELSSEFENAEIHLAHHADDLTENIFLRLFRGANVSGLCGLREFSTLNGMSIRRILLDFSRCDIEDFLQKENFNRYCTDQSNFDCTIGRNYLRNKLLANIREEFPYAPKGIIQSAKVCELDADFIEKCAESEFKKISTAKNVSNDFYAALHPALLVRILRLYLSKNLGYDYIPDRNFSQRFSEVLKSDNSGFQHKIELDEDHFYIRENAEWHIEEKNPPALQKIKWDLQNEPQIKYGKYIYTAALTENIGFDDGSFYFDAEKVTPILEISPRIDGEVFEKFGGGHTSVKEELTNRKIHGRERDEIGILRNGNGEIMLIGSFRRSSFAPIERKNQKILQIRVEKSEI